MYYLDGRNWIQQTLPSVTTAQEQHELIIPGWQLVQDKYPEPYLTT